MKSNSDLILQDPLIQEIEGSMAYRSAILDTCNWGEALTRSIVEHTENLRSCVHQHYTLQSMKELGERYQGYLDKVNVLLKCRIVQT